MSDWILTIAPSSLMEEPRWSTIVTRFESGVEQRKRRRHRSLRVFELSWKDGLLTEAQRIALLKKFEELAGSFDTFYLPSFQYETTLTSAASSGNGSIQVADATPFSDVAGAPGNRIWLQDPSTGANEVATIASISGNTLTLNSGLANSYSSGSYVHLCFKVRLADDVLSFSVPNLFSRELRIRCEEVF